MSLYFYFHVVRRVPDPNHDNFFITGAPSNSGVHSGLMAMLFERTNWIDPELSPVRSWYTNAFACRGEPIQQHNFFEPAEISRDLEQIAAQILARNNQLPVFYWLRAGNNAGITDCLPRGSVEIYYEGAPCWVSPGWNEVSIWSTKGKVRELTGIDRFACILRSRSVADCESNSGPAEDEVEGTVYIQKESFFDHLRPHLFNLFAPCDWAMQRGLQVFPMWS